MGKKYTKEDLEKKVRESDVESVEADVDKVIVFVSCGRKIVYDLDEGDYIEMNGVRWVGDDIDYYSWVRDLVRF